MFIRMLAEKMAIETVAAPSATSTLNWLGMQIDSM